MSWTNALLLLLDLEGGYQQTEPPEGATFAGIMQKYYEPWCDRTHHDKSWPPSKANVATYYYDAYWAEYHCPEFPAPADSVALQLVVNLPPERSRQCLQIAMGVYPDGVFGAKTLGAIRNYHPSDLVDRLLVAQEMHYFDTHSIGDPVIKGLFNRTQKVRAAIAQAHI